MKLKLSLSNEEIEKINSNFNKKNENSVVREQREFYKYKKQEEKQNNIKKTKLIQKEAQERKIKYREKKKELATKGFFRPDEIDKFFSWSCSKCKGTRKTIKLFCKNNLRPYFIKIDNQILKNKPFYKQEDYYNLKSKFSMKDILRSDNNIEEELIEKVIKKYQYYMDMLYERYKEERFLKYKKWSEK